MRRRPHSILLVEDNHDNRVIYGTMLRAHGFEVHDVDAGEACVELARSLQPELVLMDIGLPAMDGIQVTRVLKGDPRTSRIPVLALTAHGLQGERERAMGAGMVAYLVKPVSNEVLLREVERALRRAHEPLPIVRDMTAE